MTGMTPDPSEEDLALIRRFWPVLPTELITREYIDTAHERAAHAADPAARKRQARQGRDTVWVKGQPPGPLTLDDIKESARMQGPRPLGPRLENGQVLAILAVLIGIGVCCGAGIVGALWAVTG
jgi:hypothetical protein